MQPKTPPRLEARILAAAAIEMGAAALRATGEKISGEQTAANGNSRLR